MINWSIKFNTSIELNRYSSIFWTNVLTMWCETLLSSQIIVYSIYVNWRLAHYILSHIFCCKFKEIISNTKNFLDFMCEAAILKEISALRTACGCSCWTNKLLQFARQSQKIYQQLIH